MILFAALLAAAAVVNGCGGRPERDAQPQAVEAPPTGPSAAEIDAALAAASEYFEQGQLTAAEAILVRLIDHVPGEGRARELYALVLLSRASDASRRRDETAARHFYARAYEQYVALLDIEPDHARFHVSAGEVAQMADRDDDAFHHYQRAAALSPNDPRALFLLAQVHIQRGEHAAAERLLQRAVGLDRDDSAARASLAGALAELGRYDEALAQIAEARSLQPGEPLFRVIEASIHRRWGDHRRGLDLLLPLSERERAQMMVAAEIAALHTAADDHMKAAEAWSLAYRRNPLHPQAYLAATRAGESLLLAGEREQAGMWLQQARSAAPNAPEVKALERAIAEAPPRD
jgi:tetratricopeptide (TPR) repeat protein